jgi:hypothetical protein
MLLRILARPLFPCVSQDLWKARAEFWIRKAQNVSPAIKAAKGEACQLYSKRLADPSSWTYSTLASVGVVGVQLFGCFCIGEMLGRGSIIGYKQGAEGHH